MIKKNYSDLWLQALLTNSHPETVCSTLAFMGHKRFTGVMCLDLLPHLGDLVKVSAGQRDAIKDHVYCSKICGSKKVRLQ